MSATDRASGGLRASVVIPTYNRRSFLMQTLESLNHQSIDFERFEVVVGVDGSTDDTVDALTALKTRYSLRWVYRPNGGAAAATNTAARDARHEIIIFLDDDQVASPELVAVHLEVQQQQGPVLVQGFYPLAPGYDRRGASLVYDRWLTRSVAPIDHQHPMDWGIWSANISLPRAVWQRVGGFDESFREYGGEDADFGFRVAAIGVPVVFEPRARSYHLHQVGYRAARRQAFSSGKALVHLAGKHALPLDTMSGATIVGLPNRAVATAWRRAPRIMDILGRSLTLGLWAADVLRIRRVQLAMARVLNRFYRLGGIILESQRMGRKEGHGAA